MQSNAILKTEDAPDDIKVIEITIDNRRQWEEVMSMMQWTAPGFTHLIYKLLNAEGNPGIPTSYVPVYSLDVPVAATDAINVIFNPQTFYSKTYSLPNRVYILCHEIVHCMYGDVEVLHTSRTSGFVLMPDGRRLEFDNDCLQRAFDARINALLDESHIGEPPEDRWHDPKVKGADSVYPIYERYLQEKQGGQGGQQPGQGKPGSKPGQGQGQGQQRFDQLLKPGQASGKDPDETARSRKAEQWAVETKVAETLEAKRVEGSDGQGKLPEAMQRMFKQLLEPEVSWRDYIETLVKRQMGDGSIDWTRRHEWFGMTDTGDEYFVPADTGSGAGWIVVWGDTSGSLFDKDAEDGNKVLARNIGELAGVIDQVNPERLTLIWHDAGELKKDSVVELDEGSNLLDLKPVGGGGTDYSSVLKWIAENNRGEMPDLFIGFTDAYVTFPKDGHPFPTIWALSTDEKPPFGQIVRINNLRKGH
jgi:predicted metal-dependent peptidase